MIKKNHVAEASYHFANANYHFTGKELLTQIEKSLFCVGIFLPRQKKMWIARAVSILYLPSIL